MNKAEVSKAIEKRDPVKVPVWYNYIADETRTKYGTALTDLLKSYPDDMVLGFLKEQDWGITYAHAEGGVGTQVKDHPIKEWKDLEHYLAHVFPNPNEQALFTDLKRLRGENQNKYFLGSWWNLYFERLHYLRGIENAFADLILEKEYVNLLLDKFEEYFHTLVKRFHSEVKADGIFFGDDFGMQDRLMMSPAIFREIFKPRLKKFFELCHSYGMHTFMHTCGNVTEIVPDLIEIGLDVLHPIQPYAMDAKHIVKEYGQDISFFGGVDVQYLLPQGTPEIIDKEVKALIELFDGPHGGYIAACANTIMPETPFANIQALFSALDKYTMR